MEAKTIFNNALASRNNDIAYAKRRIGELRKARKHAMPILKHLAPLVTGEYDRMYMSAMSYEADEQLIQINIELHKLDGFKDQRLENVLFAVMALKGVEDKKSSDWPNFYNRDYKFVIGEDSPLTIDITVGAYIRSNSETCRRVKVGEKMEVTAEYEFQCD